MHAEVSFFWGWMFLCGKCGLLPSGNLGLHITRMTLTRTTQLVSELTCSFQLGRPALHTSMVTLGLLRAEKHDQRPMVAPWNLGSCFFFHHFVSRFSCISPRPIFAAPVQMATGTLPAGIAKSALDRFDLPFCQTPSPKP